MLLALKTQVLQTEDNAIGTEDTSTAETGVGLD